MVLFAADHGVVASRVSAWPSQVTGLMVRNICTGGAASAVLCRQTGTELVVVNVGSADSAAGEKLDMAPGVSYRDRPIRRGTQNLAVEPALTVAEFEQALQVGREEARAAIRDGAQVLAAGEMGIGNTTPAACLAMLLAEVPLLQAVGRGAGSDDATLVRKREIVREAVQRAQLQFKAQPLTSIAAVAGLEIVAMAGFFLEAHAAHIPTILDGYVCTAAALIAEHIVPGVAQSLIASHLSVESGHAATLEFLRLEPFLRWDLRLGEGTGALLLMPLLEAAAAIVGCMATLQSLGIERNTQA